MTNWKTFKIIKKDYVEHKDCFGFVLDGKCLMFYKDGVSCLINVPNSHSFNTYQVGDYVEVDLDRVKCENKFHIFNDINVVRKVSLSGQMSLVEQAEAFADRLVDRVEKSDGKYELDAYIQQGTDPHGTPYSRQGWIYRKK